LPALDKATKEGGLIGMFLRILKEIEREDSEE
jgi:hypothetical protein